MAAVFRQRLAGPCQTARMDADVVVIGAGLSGLVATAELADAGRRVLLLDQQPEQDFGGQAHWSFGGLFLVNSPEQRRMGIKDSPELALQDWLGTAGFDREDDHWPRQWAHAYVDFAAGEKRSWLHAQGMRWFPVVGWAERGGYGAIGHGNSVPRFHVTWGTGPGVLAPFVRRVQEAIAKGLVDYRPRHRVEELVLSGGAVTGVRGAVLAPDDAERGAAHERRRGRRFRAVGAGRRRHQRRHRRQPRPRARELARAPRRAADAHAVRRPRARRRPDAAGGAGRRRARHPPRPDVALRRGHQELGPDLGAARHPHPAGAELAVARRDRQAPAGTAVPRLRHPRHARAPAHDRSRPLVVHPHQEDHRQGVRALGLGAEPRPHRQVRAQGARAGAAPTCPRRCRRSWTRARTSSSGAPCASSSTA